MKTDKFGRPYATLSSLKAGDWLEPDGDFSCLVPVKAIQVCAKLEDGALYFRFQCRAGTHLLEGQLDYEDKDSLIGLYPSNGPSCMSSLTSAQEDIICEANEQWEEVISELENGNFPKAFDQLRTLTLTLEKIFSFSSKREYE